MKPTKQCQGTFEQWIKPKMLTKMPCKELETHSRVDLPSPICSWNRVHFQEIMWMWSEPVVRAGSICCFVFSKLWLCRVEHLTLQPAFLVCFMHYRSLLSRINWWVMLSNVACSHILFLSFLAETNLSKLVSSKRSEMETKVNWKLRNVEFYGFLGFCCLRFFLIWCSDKLLLDEQQG